MHAMHLNEIDLNLLVVFDALYVEGNTTRAGERIGLTQPAMSHALSRLRKIFSDPLFVRIPGGMRPTSRAQNLARSIRSGLDIIHNSLQENLEFDHHNSNRRFTLAMTDYSELIILSRLLKWISTVAPFIQIQVFQLQGEYTKKMLDDGKIDLIIGLLKDFGDLETGLYQQKLFVDDFLSIVRANHPLVQNKLNMKKYLELSHALAFTQGKGPGLIDKILAKQGLKRKVVLQSHHFLTLSYIVSSSDLIATIPSRAARFLASSQDIICLKPPIKIPSFTISQFWHESSHNDPANQWLRQSIYQLCSRI